ncbi:MAG: 3-methyl-2-oxobutanoate hydroxymethyltransferase [Magnetococcus sp. DMHC-6]
MTTHLTIPDFAVMKRERQKIVSVTAYDYTFAALLDQAGVDLLLVGDSLGMVIQGQENTLSVTLEEMIYHTRAVVRGAKRALVVCDLPFGSFQCGPEAAMRSAVRAMKESGCQAVKLEGGLHLVETIDFLVRRGIPVVGHVGLTPQSVHQFGGFKVRGRGAEGEGIFQDARAVTEAGASMIILEGIPSDLAQRITLAVGIPTIGIGAGAGCDGQVLVLYDLLGLYDTIRPKFVKHYLEGGTLVGQAVGQFIREVRAGNFPGAEHEFANTVRKARKEHLE